MTLPNFLIVGAARSGTTSLYHYVCQHPEVYMSPVKEPKFFARERLLVPFRLLDVHSPLITDWDSYSGLFQTVDREKAIGEASTAYLYHHETAIREIKKHLGDDVRIVIILRNPTHRAFSHYLLMKRAGLEHLSFEEAIARDEDRRKSGKYIPALVYVSYGLYCKCVEAYLESFPQVKICIYDDLKMDPVSFMKDLYEFLGVDSSFVPSLRTKYNVSGVPKNRLIHNLLVKPNILRSSLRPIVRAFIPPDKRRALAERIRSATLKKPEMKRQTRQYLLGVYREDILKLQDLIERDLSNWLR